MSADFGTELLLAISYIVLPLAPSRFRLTSGGAMSSDIPNSELPCRLFRIESGFKTSSHGGWMVNDSGQQYLAQAPPFVSVCSRRRL